jgi:hypothetical protein
MADNRNHPQYAVSVNPDQIAADLYGPVDGREPLILQQLRAKPLMWADATPSQRMSIARRAQNVVCGALRLPVRTPNLYDLATLNHSDYRPFLESLVTNAVGMQNEARRRGHRPLEGGAFPEHPGAEQLFQAVRAGMDGRFRDEMMRYGAAQRAEGHNGSGFQAFVFDNVRWRTGAADLAADAAQAAVDGWTRAALAEPRLHRTTSTRHREQETNFGIDR